MRNETIAARRSALKSLSTVRNVEAAKVEAWKTLAATDEESAAALILAVRAAVAGGTYADHLAVESVASVAAAAYFLGRTDSGADRTLAAARAAVRFAVKRVAETYAVETTMTDALHPITGENGDMIAALEDALASGYATAPLTARMPSIGEGAHESFLDRVESLVWRATRNDGGAFTDGLTYAEGAELIAAVRAYADHLMGADQCPVCDGAPSTRRPTLASVLSHVAGERTNDAAGKARMRRVARLVATLGDFLPSMLDDDTTPRPSVPSATRMVRTATDNPPAVVTVRTRGGMVATRSVTEAEAEAIATPNYGAPQRLTAHAGEGQDVIGTAPQRPSPTTGMVPSGKVPVSPRAKSGSGSTGPTVVVRPGDWR